uniref:Uncharacterized protein n=1 Tax=Oryza punctata TaxID=4537 RepID=A0A0E0KPN1_ORYPU
MAPQRKHRLAPQLRGPSAFGLMKLTHGVMYVILKWPAATVVSRLVAGGSGHGHGEDGGISGSVERLEMAQSRMEAAHELSTRWPITDVSLLRATAGALRRQKQRAVQQDEAAAICRSRSTLPRRIAHATRSFVSALIGGRGEDDSSSSAAADVRRFERLAEFLKLVELGGARPRQQHALLAGETLSYLAQRGAKFYYLGVRPVSFEERGVEAMVGFVVKDFTAPARSFSLGLMVRLSELGTMIDCMQCEERARPAALLTATTNIGSTSTWYRPNPLCCTDHHHRTRSRITSSNSGVSPPSTKYPEHVIVVYLQCYIPSPPPTNELVVGVKDDEQLTPLKMTVLFIPHDHDNPEEDDDGAKPHARLVRAPELRAR